MKRNFQTLFNQTFLRAIAAALVFFTASFAGANPDLDRKYALETVGFLRAWDNVDGLFGDYVARAYQAVFERSSRFRLNDLSKTDVILANAKIPYQKLIDDKDILAEVAKSTRVESIIRTKVFKEGSRYRFELDWLYSPSMVRIASHSFYYNDPRKNPEATTSSEILSAEQLQSDIGEAVDHLIEKLPFLGHITGRDKDSVTINVGYASQLKKGDHFQVGTLEDVKVHPLLNQIVDWAFFPTGTIEVDQVEEKIAFGRIVSLESGREVMRYQKLIKWIPSPLGEGPASEIAADPADEAQKRYLPRYGFISAGAYLGSFGRDFSTGDFENRGGGTVWGFKTENELWLTPNFFADLELGFGFFSYGQDRFAGGQLSVPEPPEGNGSGQLTKFRLNLGYQYLVDGNFFGPKAFVRFGYRSNSTTLPLSTADHLGSLTVKGLFLGIGGDMPIRDDWGALLAIDLDLLKDEQVEGVAGYDPDGSTDVSFFLGGYKQLMPRLTIRAGFDINVQNVDFMRGEALTHRSILFTPSLLYYF